MTNAFICSGWTCTQANSDIQFPLTFKNAITSVVCITWTSQFFSTSSPAYPNYPFPRSYAIFTCSSTNIYPWPPQSFTISSTCRSPTNLLYRQVPFEHAANVPRKHEESTAFLTRELVDGRTGGAGSVKLVAVSERRVGSLAICSPV